MNLGSRLHRCIYVHVEFRSLSVTKVLCNFDRSLGNKELNLAKDLSCLIPLNLQFDSAKTVSYFIDFMQ